MPPVYFHGKYSRYKERSNSIWQSKFSATIRYFSTQLPPLAMYFHLWWTKACMLFSLFFFFKFALADMTNCFTAAVTALLLKHTTHHFSMLTANIWSPEVFSNCQRMSVGADFSREDFNSIPFFSYILPCQTPFCCPSAATCHKATKCNGISVGRFSHYCHNTNMCLWCHGLT